MAIDIASAFGGRATEAAAASDPLAGMGMPQMGGMQSPGMGNMQGMGMQQMGGMQGMGNMQGMGMQQMGGMQGMVGIQGQIMGMNSILLSVQWSRETSVSSWTFTWR